MPDKSDGQKLIVFDVDGTILDSFTLFEKAIAHYSKEQGLPMPDVQAIKYGYNDPNSHDFGWGVSKEEQLRHLNGAFDLFDAWPTTGEIEKTPLLFDGAKEVFAEFKNAGHTLGIITSKPEEPLLKILGIHGVTEYFTSLRSRDDILRRSEKEKPHPDMLQSVMRELKFNPADTVMIGDTTMDMRMGRSADAKTIGVTWGAHLKEHLADAGAHHIVDTKFNDVMAAVKRIFNKN